MRTRISLIVIVSFVLIAAGWLHAQGSAESDAAAKEVLGLLRELEQAFVRHDAETIKRLVADDHLAILSYGRVETKADSLKLLPEKKFAFARMEDVKATAVGKDVVRVLYKVIREGSFEGKALSPENYVFSIWVKRSAGWQEVAYQETPIPK